VGSWTCWGLQLSGHECCSLSGLTPANSTLTATGSVAAAEGLAVLLIRGTRSTSGLQSCQQYTRAVTLRPVLMLCLMVPGVDSDYMHARGGSIAMLCRRVSFRCLILGWLLWWR
jgi:hypothetical protein